MTQMYQYSIKMMIIVYLSCRALCLDQTPILSASCSTLPGECVYISVTVYYATIARSMRPLSVVVNTFALHAKGRRFEPGRGQ